MYLYVVVEMDCPPYESMVAKNLLETDDVELAFSKKDELEQANLNEDIEYMVEVVKLNPPSGE